jgi:ubiquinone/menaquinone biosynthesis C-methylase UbiE
MNAGATTEAGSLRHAIQQAYNQTGAAWAGGPTRVYGRLAHALVEHRPVDLRGRTMLDLGAGTGALSVALRGVGAVPVALDVALAMLATDRDRRPPAAVGDAQALPFASGSFDGAGAAFSLSHVPSPAAAFHEIARVLRPDGVLLVSSYGSANPHAVKRAVDGAAAALGYEPPAWHDALKQTTEPQVGSIDALTSLAHAAGLGEVEVVHEAVDVGLDDPAALVAWRLGMPNLVPFLATLTDAQRSRLTADALAALGPDPEPYRPEVLFLTARRA